MQRALFARRSLQDAAVILLDEPFTAIDARTTADLLDLVARLARARAARWSRCCTTRAGARSTFPTHAAARRASRSPGARPPRCCAREPARARRARPGTRPSLRTTMRTRIAAAHRGIDAADDAPRRALRRVRLHAPRARRRVALSLGAAPIGVFLMLRRMSLTGDAMAHAILPGAALGFLVAGLSLPAMTLGGLVGRARGGARCRARRAHNRAARGCEPRGLLPACRWRSA